LLYDTSFTASYIGCNDLKQNINNILEKVKGSNILNFSNYFDEIFDYNQLNSVFNLLSEEELKEINDIKYLLAKNNDFMILFDKDKGFERQKEEAFFNFQLFH